MMSPVSVQDFISVVGPERAPSLQSPLPNTASLKSPLAHKIDPTRTRHSHKHAQYSRGTSLMGTRLLQPLPLHSAYTKTSLFDMSYHGKSFTVVTLG